MLLTTQTKFEFHNSGNTLDDFNTALSSAIESAAPLIIKKWTTKRPAPWFNQDTRTLKRSCRKLDETCPSSPSTCMAWLSRIPGRDDCLFVSGLCVGACVFVLSGVSCHSPGSAWGGMPVPDYSHTWLMSSPHLLLINCLQYLRSSHTSSLRRIVVKYCVCYGLPARNSTFATFSCLFLPAWASLLPSVFCHLLTVSLFLRNQSSPLSWPLSGSPPPPDSHSLCQVNCLHSNSGSDLLLGSPQNPDNDSLLSYKTALTASRNAYFSSVNNLNKDNPKFQP